MRSSLQGTLAAACAIALALGAMQSGAQEPAAAAKPAASTQPGQAPPEPSPQAGVALDQLLTLPSFRTYSVERKGGFTRGEWRTRYGEVRTELQKERDALAASQGKLDDAGGGKWKVNPIPGADTSSEGQETPIDFQLRSELRKHREEVERLERKLRQLDIEANLAGVPEDWRR